MPIPIYEYQRPDKTYTIEQYVACQSDTVACYRNMSFTDLYNGSEYEIYNVISDYLEELRSEDYSLTVELTNAQLDKYMYKPKLLCHELYNNTEVHFIILAINDMYSVKQFNKKILKLPTVTMMETLCTQIMNANREAIETYKKFKNNRMTR